MGLLFKVRNKVKLILNFFVEHSIRRRMKQFNSWLLAGKCEESFSQYKQDLFVKYYFSSVKKDSFFFVDIGANDGITFSNTLALEKSHNQKWNGICIEADPMVYSLLEKNRPNASNYNVALCDRDGIAEFYQIIGYPQMLSGILSEYDSKHMERINREIKSMGGEAKTIAVPSAKFDTILKKHPEITHIDYLSIDVEGGEMNILKDINFNYFDITLIGVEDNYQDQKLIKFFKERGYRPVLRLDADIFFEKCR